MDPKRLKDLENLIRSQLMGFRIGTPIGASRAKVTKQLDTRTATILRSAKELLAETEAAAQARVQQSMAAPPDPLRRRSRATRA